MDPSGKRVLHHPAENSQAGWAGRGGNDWYSCPIPNLTLRQKTTSAGIMQTHNSYFDDKTETPPPSCLLGWVTAMAPPSLLTTLKIKKRMAGGCCLPQRHYRGLPRRCWRRQIMIRFGLGQLICKIVDAGCGCLLLSI